MALNINGTTGISGVEGSVSAPVLTGTDSNCGISFPAADTIKFSTGGVERMQITNSGVTGTGIGAGKLLQIVTATTSTQHSNSSTTFADTGLSASITPSATSSKILILISQAFHVESTSSDAGGNIRLLRDSTTLDSDNHSRAGYIYVALATGMQLNMVYNQHILDSPNTTSSITYKTQDRMYYGTHIIKTQTGSKPSFITLIEVGA